jgi:ribosomal protein S18 acetylase RimI-like enzyme
VSVRRAVQADGLTIAGIHQRSWQATYRGILPDDVLDGFDLALTGQRWGSAAAAPDAGCAILVAERGEEVVGFTSVRAAEDEPTAGELETLYVEPGVQRSGVGCELLDSAVEALVGFGRSEAILWVAEANVGAQAFYSAFGWRPDGGTGLWRGARTARYRRALEPQA